MLDPDADVFDRGRAILRTLRRLTASRPTVLAIDDVQWLDPISVRSLRYALRRLEDQPIAVLATERSGPGDPLGPLLLPVDRTETLTVGALSIEAIRLVVAPVVGAIPRPALELIQQMSAGNPMYALELARTTDPGGNRLATARRDTLRGILSARLAATPPEVLDLLRTAAALGPAPSGRLMAACGGPEGGPQLAAAVELGLLTVDESFIVRFTHPLLASVVLGQITPPRGGKCTPGSPRSSPSPTTAPVTWPCPRSSRTPTSRPNWTPPPTAPIGAARPVSPPS